MMGDGGRYDRPVGYLVSLVRELCGLPGETEWVEAVESGQIVLEDPEVGTRVRRYVPFWAASQRREKIA